MNELYSENVSIIDRMNNTLMVTCNCRSCYNIIWNALPTSLHRNIDRIQESASFDLYRLDFTLEDPDRMMRIIGFFDKRLQGSDAEDVFAEGSYTTGHFKRGAE